MNYRVASLLTTEKDENYYPKIIPVPVIEAESKSFKDKMIVKFDHIAFIEFNIL